MVVTIPDGRETTGFTSRMQKGGSLLEDMRRLVMIWESGMETDNPLPTIMRTLGKNTIARAKDVYIRSFRPRFLEGNPPNAWRLVRLLEDAGAPTEVVKPFYYWITARTEHPLYEFVTQDLFPRSGQGTNEVTIEGTTAWLRDRLLAIGKTWTPTVQRKVARGILATLRDFDILEGRSKKRVLSQHLAIGAFTGIAFCLHTEGASGQSLLEHPDWRLFLLREQDIERFLLEAHQLGWLRYQAAGRICRIDFPVETFEEYVHVILG